MKLRKFMKITRQILKQKDEKIADQHRVCLFYVTNRIRSILGKNRTEEDLRNQLEEFEDECLHNLGVNALMERYE